MKTAAEVDALLRKASDLSARAPLDAPRVDMSPEAINLRLRQASDLSDACLRLAHVGTEGGLDGSGRSE